MVRKQDDNQAESRQNAEKPHGGQPRVEHLKPEQQTRTRTNNQGYNQSQRGQGQSHQQGNIRAGGGQSANQGANQSQNQSQQKSVVQGNKPQSERNDGHPRENGQNKGYYRDRNRNNDRDAHRRQYPSAPSGSKYGNIQRNRADETIDDIKEDIIRLEKEIDLEIKEIRSLKL